jgi:phosphoenolpyruvate carboxylase
MSSVTVAEFEDLLKEADACAARDPFTNPHLLFALGATERMAKGTASLDDLDVAVSDLTAQAFAARAERLGAYLGGPDAEDATALFERQAEKGFDAYAALLAHPAVGVVTTAHPTFALDHDLSLALVELATGRTEQDEPLDEAGRAARLALAHERRHRPPASISLDMEHDWSVRALTNLVDGLDEARRAALAVARRRWPDRWRSLQPRLMTVATWVGFDQDGRTDVTWDVSLGKRLALKAVALTRYLALARRARAVDIIEVLARALAAVERQAAALAGLDAKDFVAVSGFSRVFVAERDEALVDPRPLLATIDRALVEADDDCAAELILLKTQLEVQGVCLAHIHVRLNAAQLHNAIRAKLGLETSPSDPANRRSYFQAINGLIEDCEPIQAGLRELLAESSSSKQLFITIAEMARSIDATSPVRFLIAETESGFTLLVALYFARLYGVENLIEISPLFETAEALIRGEAVIEEALKSPAYRAGLVAQGKLAVEFGFSDSGRFIGQLAATFRIERLRLRLAELLEREGLCDLKLILFNTHGESMGRGGHPTSLADRLAYAAPPQDRREFAKRGVRVREEDSFQGGDGYLPLFTRPAARATVRGLLAFALEGMDGEADDPVYDQPDFASEFFATIQQAFSSLIADPDYVALLSLYGTRTLAKTGSRPEQRQSQDASQVAEFKEVSQLRAIPNNAILQGLAALANLTFGVGRAAAKNPALFKTLYETSPRFRRALDMAAQAAALSDIQATRAYAATVNPSLWLDRQAVEFGDGKVLGALTRLSQRAGLTESLSRALRRLRAERPLQPALSSAETPRRSRVRLLHALRISLIQRAALVAARIPPFTPQGGVTREGIQLRIMRLDILSAVRDLAEQFPLQPSGGLNGLDFGEGAALSTPEVSGYAREHEQLLKPLLKLHDLVLSTTAALNHEIGACG